MSSQLSLRRLPETPCSQVPARIAGCEQNETDPVLQSAPSQPSVHKYVLSPRASGQARCCHGSSKSSVAQPETSLFPFRHVPNTSAPVVPPSRPTQGPGPFPLLAEPHSGPQSSLSTRADETSCGGSCLGGPGGPGLGVVTSLAYHVASPTCRGGQEAQSASAP